MQLRNTTMYCLRIQNHPNIKLNAYHMKIRDCAYFRALVAKLFDFPSYLVSYVIFCFVKLVLLAVFC